MHVISLLSVPYFTGFVMLHGTFEVVEADDPPFSPLFYGIRDVTPFYFYNAANTGAFQSPILRDS